MNVDTNSNQLTINGMKVISASMAGNELKVEYHGDVTEWDEFKQDAESLACETYITLDARGIHQRDAIFQKSSSQDP